jgi:hypothetical protein
MAKEEKLGVEEMAKTVGLFQMTFYRYLSLRGVETRAYGGRTVKNAKIIDLTAYNG